MKNEINIGMSTLAMVALLAAIVATPLIYFIKKQKNVTAPQKSASGTIVLLNGTSAAGKTSIMESATKNIWQFIVVFAW